MDYYPRCADEALQEMLLAFGGVLVQGPRACGKTLTALRLAGSSVRLDRSPESVRLAQDQPGELLGGATPRLIDEWQLAPALWNAIRHEIDQRQEKGQFIFCGSAVPASDNTRHTGAGRIGRLRMRPMSLAESQKSSAEVSLASLFRGTEPIRGRASLSYAALAEQAVIGGWPGLLGVGEKQARKVNLAYLDDVAETELPLEIGRHFAPVRVKRVLQSLARNLSGELSVAGTRRDASPGEGEANDKTIRADLDALQRIFVLDPLHAWSVELRSRARLRTKAKIHLADPSLALAALRTDSARLSRQPSYFGQVFESMVIRDLRAYVSLFDGELFHYRDSNGLEVDAIIETDLGWAAVEVKLGASQFDAAEANLLKFKETVNTDLIGEPVFLAIISGTEYAYTLPSGVHVIPLSALTW